MKQIIHKLSEPFPHLIVENMYNEEELKLIWEELTFLTKPNKLLDPTGYGGASINGRALSTAKALILELAYSRKELSNILTLSRKLFDGGYLSIFSKISPNCITARYMNNVVTKVRYYKNLDAYEPHRDMTSSYLICTYFNKEPKCFSGGQLYFPEYNYEFECKNNSMILMPTYILHGVKQVNLENDYYLSGNGRYCITQFLQLI